MSDLPPRAVQIGPHPYTVRVKKLEGFLGRTTNKLAKIQLDREQSPSNMKDTLVHESLHAILAQSGALANLKFEGNTEEQLVATLSPWILQWIQDNPDLIAFLTSPVATQGTRS